MKIETHEVDTGHVTELPEPVIESKHVWMVTAIDRVKRKPVVFLPAPGKGNRHEVPYLTEGEAKSVADRLAKQHPKFAHIRIQKLEIA